MPTPMTPPALAGAGAIDQVPMLRAAAARAAIQRRECSEIFLKLSMFPFSRRVADAASHTVKICRLMPSATPTRSMTPAGTVLRSCSVGEGRGPRAGV